MSSRDDVGKLRGLNRNEATVLYWKCRGKTYEEIGLDLDYSSDWVQFQMSSVYRKLDFSKDMHWRERTRLLEESYCKALRTMVRDDPKNLDQWPFPAEEPQPDPVMYPLVLYDEMRQEEERGLAKYEPKPIIIKDPPPPPPPPEPQGRRLLRYALGLLALLAVGFAAYIIGTFREPETVTQLTQAPVVETVIITNTPEPIATPVPPTSVVDAVATDRAFDEMTLTARPTNTPEPTDTPQPTRTPTPTPLFFDDFTGSTADSWTIIEGDTTDFVDNQFSVLGNFVAVAGDSSWTDYVVSVIIPYLEWSYFDGGLEIQVRRQDDFNYMAVQMSTINSCSIRWLEVVNGEKREILDSRKSLGGWPACRGTWKIGVDGDSYTLTKDVTPINQIQNSSFSNGGFSIRTNSNGTKMTLDEVKIVALP